MTVTHPTVTNLSKKMESQAKALRLSCRRVEINSHICTLITNTSINYRQQEISIICHQGLTDETGTIVMDTTLPQSDSVEYCIENLLVFLQQLSLAIPTTNLIWEINSNACLVRESSIVSIHSPPSLLDYLQRLSLLSPLINEATERMANSELSSKACRHLAELTSTTFYEHVIAAGEIQ